MPAYLSFKKPKKGFSFLLPDLFSTPGFKGPVYQFSIKIFTNYLEM